MDAAIATLRAQRAVVMATIALTAVAVNLGDADVFTIPKATVLWCGAVVVLALAAIRWAWARQVAVPAEPAALAVVAFVAGMAVTTLTSSTPMQSLVGQYTYNAGFATYAAGAVLFAAVLRANKPELMPALVRTYVAAAVVVLGYALLQVAGLDPADWSRQDQVFSTMGNPNFLAGWCGVVVPLGAWVALRADERPPWRVAGAAVAVAGLLVAFATASFQGPVAVAAGVAAFVLLTYRVPRRLLAIAAAGAVVVLVVAGPRIVDEIDEGLLEREHFWSVAIDVGLDHPVLGTGPDTFHNEFLPRRSAEHAAIPASRNAGAAHDVPLQLFAGGGLLVLLPYLAFVALVAVRLAQGLRRLDDPGRRTLLAALGAAWIGYQVQSLVSIDKPAAVVASFVLSAAVLVVAAPLRWKEVVLPGGGRPVLDVPPATWVVTAAAVVAGLVGLWFALVPQRADLANEKGVRVGKRGDLAAAEVELERARRLAPWEARYVFDLVRLRQITGDADGAIAEAEAGARLEPGDSSYALFAARTAGAAGRFELASEWFDEALRRDPYGLDVLEAAAEHEARNGDPERAAALADRLLAVTEQRADVWVIVHAVRDEIGDDEGADEAARRARELDPDVELLPLGET